LPQAEPPRRCRFCPRLATFRTRNCALYPDHFNAPVPCFGDANAALLIVGLAPGLHGANCTGRPFTGDYAGDLLFAMLLKHGLARGIYAQAKDDGLELVGACIANAVRCVPPENKPTPDEIKTCRPFLAAKIAEMKSLKAILALGKIAHDSVCDVLGAKKSAHPFRHGIAYRIGDLTLLSSYHCSRYNTNTGRLTEAMFDAVMTEAAMLARPIV
jgi:uracil-DNA glycosylase